MSLRTHALLALAGLISTAHADTPPPPPPPLPPVAKVLPTLLEGYRVAGTKAIVPDDVTKAAISRSGMEKTISAFKLCLAIDGAINSVTILKSSGFAEYDQKIVRTIQGEWKYKPYTVDGKPVPVCTAVTFIYSQKSADPPPRAADSVQPVKTSAVKVKLVKAGAAPTRTPRLALHKGGKSTLVMTSQSTRARGIKGKLGPAEPQPGVRFELELEVTDVAASGDAGVDLLYRKVEPITVKGASAPAGFAAALGKLAGMKGHFTVTARGLVKDFDLAVPPDAASELRQTIEASRSTFSQLSDELPDEPIGVGAVWETTRRVTGGELTVDVTTTRELTAVDGTRLTFKVSQTQHGRGSGPGNLTTEARGTGEVVLDLGTVIPTRVRFDLQQDIELDADGARLAQHHTSTLTLTAR
jgi:hypothetical protein